MGTELYALAGGIAHEFKSYAEASDRVIFVSALSGEPVKADTMLALGNIELDVERERVNAVMDYLVGMDGLRVSMSTTDIEVWDYTWDNLITKYDFDGTTIQVLPLAKVFARILVAVAKREQEFRNA